jgi:periplasmic divalent cation tolerance protein
MIPDKSQSPDFSGGFVDQATDGLVLVLTTWPIGAPVETMAEAVVRDGLAACVSVLSPHRSVYRWEGRVEHADEQQLLIKTTRGKLRALEEAVHAAHPYDVPEFLVLNVEAASHAYAAWVMDDGQ